CQWSGTDSTYLLWLRCLGKSHQRDQASGQFDQLLLSRDTTTVNKTNNALLRVAIASALVSGATLVSLPASGADQPAPHKMVMRYNVNRQVTGVIHPSADATALYPATRNTYDSKGLLTVVE